MKRFLILACVLALLLCGCGGAEPQEAEAAPSYRTEAAFPYPTFSYTHYASGGTAEEYTAVILFEQSCSTFTSYQVAFSSCTCRDALVNYLSVCYVELLNTKATAQEASIRATTFGNNQGLWGDSNPNYYQHDYTEEYMDENFVQSFVGVSMEEISAWNGYGSQIGAIDADAVSGATVSTSNITSMLQGLFAYHAEHYYREEPVN